METVAYPALLAAADAAAVRAQNRHVLFSFLELAILIVAAIAAALSPIEVKIKGASFDAMALSTGFALIVSLGLSVASRTARNDRRWFASRAIAESVKTETWRYMMRPASKEEDAHFRSRLNEILSSQPDAHSEVATSGAEAAWITDTMRQATKEPLRDKFIRYCQDRLKDQRSWYSKRAAENRRAERLWFGIGIGTQVAATSLVLLSLLGLVLLVWVGVATTLAASFLAWTQLRDHQRQALSYALISQELAGVDTSRPPADYPALKSLVEDVERTISREHSMWLTRR